MLRHAASDSGCAIGHRQIWRCEIHSAAIVKSGDASGGIASSGEASSSTRVCSGAKDAESGGGQVSVKHGSIRWAMSFAAASLRAIRQLRPSKENADLELAAIILDRVAKIKQDSWSAANRRKYAKKKATQ